MLNSVNSIPTAAHLQTYLYVCACACALDKVLIAGTQAHQLICIYKYRKGYLRQQVHHNLQGNVPNAMSHFLAKSRLVRIINAF